MADDMNVIDGLAYKFYEVIRAQSGRNDKAKRAEKKLEEALHKVPTQQLHYGREAGGATKQIRHFIETEFDRRRELEETERQKTITKYASDLTAESARKASWRTFGFAVAGVILGSLVNPFGNLAVSTLTPSDPPAQVETPTAPTN
jgi:hypothetical protein